MNILITGSEGFLGKVLVQRFLEQGQQVFPFDLQLGMDILSRNTLREKLKNIDICIHAAAISDLNKAIKNPQLCHDINAKGAFFVGQVCQSLSIKLLYLSTACVYGNNNEKLQTENSIPHPTEIYAKKKLQGEQFLEQMPVLDYKIARLATFYGKTMRNSLAIYKFINAFKNEKTIKIHGDGKQTRKYTHVDDIVSGIISIVEKWPRNIIYNIAGDEEISVNEIIHLIAQLTNKTSKTKFIADRKGQIFSSKIDNSRIKTIGWTPKYSMEEGIKSLL